jgi:hypothetical protein
MSHDKDDAKSPEKVLPQRKPYVPPAVVETGSFEQLTLSCTHLPTGMGNCHPADVRS